MLAPAVAAEEVIRRANSSARVRKGFSRAKDRDGHGWSWTQLNMLADGMQSPGGPTDWINRYVLGHFQESKGPEAIIGSAFHKAAELGLKKMWMGHTFSGPGVGHLSSDVLNRMDTWDLFADVFDQWLVSNSGGLFTGKDGL